MTLIKSTDGSVSATDINEQRMIRHAQFRSNKLAQSIEWKVSRGISFFEALSQAIDEDAKHQKFVEEAKARLATMPKIKEVTRSPSYWRYES